MEVEPIDDDSLPDRLMNPGEYEPFFHTPNATAEPAEEELVNEAQRRLTPVYTYGSINYFGIFLLHLNLDLKLVVFVMGTKCWMYAQHFSIPF